MKEELPIPAPYKESGTSFLTFVKNTIIALLLIGLSVFLFVMVRQYQDARDDMRFLENRLEELECRHIMFEDFSTAHARRMEVEDCLAAQKYAP